MYAITILIPFLLALDAMFAAPFGGVIGIIMISCLSGYDDSDPLANIAALSANTLAAICVQYGFGGGVFREIHGIALMCACKDSWGVAYPSAVTVAIIMIMHKLLTCDKNMLYLDLVMVICAATPSLRRIPLQVILIPTLMLAPDFDVLSQVFNGVLTLAYRTYLFLCRVLRKPKMVHTSTQMDTQNQPPPQLAISGVMTVTDMPPITPPKPPMPTSTIYSHESVLEIFRKAKPRITFLRRSSFMREKGIEARLVEEILQAPDQTISSREYLRNKWDIAKLPNQPKPAEVTPEAIKLIASQPSIQQPIVEESTMNQSTIERPAIEEYVTEKFTPEEPTLEKPSDDNPSLETLPAPSSPFGQPAGEEPLDVQPAVEQLVTEQAVDFEGRNTENPPIDDSATFEQPPAEQQSIVPAITDQPTSQSPDIQEMPPTEQLTEVHSMEELAISETLVGEPSAEQCAIEQPSEEAAAESTEEDLAFEQLPYDELAQYEEDIYNGLLHNILTLDISQQGEDSQSSSEQVVIHEPPIIPAPAESGSDIQFLENLTDMEQAVENGHIFGSDQFTLTQPTPVFTFSSEQSTEAGQPTSNFNFGAGQFTSTFSFATEQPTEVEYPAAMFNFGAEQFTQPEQHEPISFFSEQPTQAPQPIPVPPFGNEQFTEAEQPTFNFNFGDEQSTLMFYGNEEPIRPEEYGSMSYLASHQEFSHIGQLAFPGQLYNGSQDTTQGAAIEEPVSGQSQDDQGSSDQQIQQISPNEPTNSDDSASRE
ncbi:hypothetical protein F4814DRAFT_443663 [Daldinia grandis]|nr:hypothetical protein F4814DRAFT_443663 [Daldinia grandis]